MRGCGGVGRRLSAGTAAAGVLLVAFAVSAPAPAQAHPFGEPQTVRLSAEGSVVTLRWSAAPDDLVLLGGAVGALPNRRELVFDTTPGSEPEPVGPSDAERITSSPEVAAYLESHLAVRQDGQDCPPEATLDDLVEDGALVVFECPAVVDEVEVAVTTMTDFHEAYRTVAIGDGASVPDRSLYTVSEPLQTWSFGPAGLDRAPESGMPPATSTQLGMLEQRLVHAFDGAVMVPVALLVAAAIGAAHGLAPGHGKTMAGAYLVGARARRRHAVVLAGIVGGMHTASVLLLGLLWWVAVGDGPVPIDSVTRWAQLAVAVAVLSVGVAITRRRWRERRSSHHHGQRGDPAPWSWPGLVGIASAGGLLPSPSAFLVLISGLLTGRAGLALSMVVAFGLGLATTVLATGLLTVAGRDWLGGHGSGHARARRVLEQLPLVGAVGVLAGGCLLCVVAVSGLMAVA